jgi:hypothetical protein
MIFVTLAAPKELMSAAATPGRITMTGLSTNDVVRMMDSMLPCLRLCITSEWSLAHTPFFLGSLILPLGMLPHLGSLMDPHSSAETGS